MRIPHEELLTLWKLETLRELKNAVSDMSLYIYELGDEDPARRAELEGIYSRLNEALDDYRDVLGLKEERL